MNRSPSRLRNLATTVITGMALIWTGYVGLQTAYGADADNGNRPAARDDSAPPLPPEGQSDQPPRERQAPADRPPRDGQGADGRPPREAQGTDARPPRDAQDNEVRSPRDSQAGRERRPVGPPGVQRALDELRLTDAQKQKADPIVQEFRRKQQQAREDFLKQMKEVLEPQQYERLEQSMALPPPPANGDGRDRAEPSRNNPDAPRRDGADAPQRDSRETPRPDSSDAPRRGTRETPRPDAPPSPRRDAPAEPQAGAPADGTGKIAVSFTGGYDTDPRDHGRPVALIAAALNVAPEVFRNAFSHVTPAPGGQEPQPEQVRRNKSPLLESLSPFGIANDRLDAVSNYYRYSGSKGEMWRNAPATAYATVRNGVVTGFTLTNPGAGYTTPPKVSIASMPGLSAVVTLLFDTDFSKNGSIKEITVKP